MSVWLFMESTGSHCSQLDVFQDQPAYLAHYAHAELYAARC